MTKTDTDVEIWEPTTESAVHVLKRDPRDPTGWRHTKIGGKRGSRRLQLTRDERVHNQDLMAVENRHLDPFRNGQLICLSGDLVNADGQMSDEDLRELLAIESDDVFLEAVSSLDTEVLLRRLLLQAEEFAVKRRYDMIYNFVADKYRIGYTQKAVREMEAEDDAVPTVI